MTDKNFRNICILAHVDHGKTTLSDSLVASNGIISSRSAGKVRYLDSREDEQQRGITMKSSSILLNFKLLRNIISEQNETKTTETSYNINLIDSPGHVDFSSEVSTASRLTDGALILVDVVEGVQTQTITVLKQAYMDSLKPILVLNKIDRMITELKFSPSEAFIHLKQILEQVNAIMATFFSEELMEEDAKKLKQRQEINDQKGEIGDEHEWILEDKDDSHIYFSPEQGNVIFSSAIDGWAFRTHNFAQLYASKLNIKESLLRKVLWGEYYLDTKAKRVVGPNGLKGRNLKPMFVQFILENIWAVYDAVLLNTDREKIEKIMKTLNLKILPRDLKTKDMKSLVQNMMSQWLPLSATVLIAVVDVIPSPKDAQPVRFPKLLDQISHDTSFAPDESHKKSAFSIPKNIYESLCVCDSDSSRPTIAFVSKMFSVPRSELPENKRGQLSAEEMKAIRERRQQAVESVSDDMKEMSIKEDSTERNEEVLIGFSRIYSGTLKKGDQIYVLGPKYDPRYPNEHSSTVTIGSLYQLMGRDLKPLEQVTAGMVFGVGGLEEAVLKTATLSSVLECPNLGGVNMIGAPIVRVALEPVDPGDMQKLSHGLKLLNQADPCVEVLLQETGEHVIGTAGELHLERCLKDLKERFAKIDISVSPPIVPFRETISHNPSLKNEKSDGDEEDLPIGSVKCVVGDVCSIRIRAVPIPNEILSLIQDSGVLKRYVHDEMNDSEKQKFLETLESAAKSVGMLHGIEWTNLVSKIVAFGPKRIGPNILCNLVEGAKCLNDSEDARPKVAITDYEHSIITGFQLATAAGPLCAEPMHGLCFIIESFEIAHDADATKLSMLSGQIISSIKEAYKNAFLRWSPRLMIAMYSCDLQAPSDVLGKVYAVLSKRKGRILSEEMKDGTPFFLIKSLLPIIESFGFSDDIRKRTSGAASPQLIFHGYELLDIDPFWVPTTEEELEDLGEKADRENIAKRYMDSVRKRKGMAVERKIVEHAEKQKTLKNK